VMLPVYNNGAFKFLMTQQTDIPFSSVSHVPRLVVDCITARRFD
jgi:hypothetical protein